MGKQFKLESVLNYRQILEREAQQELARALGCQGEVMAQIARQRAEMDYLTRDFETRKLAGLPIADLNLYRSHIHCSSEQLQALESELEKANAAVSKCRTELMKSCQDRKMVEKLKQHQNEVHKRELLHQENLSLDEVGLSSRQGGLT